VKTTNHASIAFKFFTGRYSTRRRDINKLVIHFTIRKWLRLWQSGWRRSIEVSEMKTNPRQNPTCFGNQLTNREPLRFLLFRFYIPDMHAVNRYMWQCSHCLATVPCIGSSILASILEESGFCHPEFPSIDRRPTPCRPTCDPHNVESGTEGRRIQGVGLPRRIDTVD
jgi:hypothetical protein